MSGSGRNQGRRPNVSTPIGRLLVQRGVRKHQLAAATGISLRELGRLLAGHPPTSDQALRLAAAFEVPVRTITGG